MSTNIVCILSKMLIEDIFKSALIYFKQASRSISQRSKLANELCYFKKCGGGHIFSSLSVRLHQTRWPYFIFFLKPVDFKNWDLLRQLLTSSKPKKTKTTQQCLLEVKSIFFYLASLANSFTHLQRCWLPQWPGDICLLPIACLHFCVTIKKDEKI